MRDETFNLIYYGFLFCVLFIIIISAIIGMSLTKFDYSNEKLRLMKTNSKKGMLIYAILALLLPVVLVPFHIFQLRFFLLVQFIIIILTVLSYLLFMVYLRNYCKILKILKSHDEIIQIDE